MMSPRRHSCLAGIEFLSERPVAPGEGVTLGRRVAHDGCYATEAFYTRIVYQAYVDTWNA